MDLEISGFGQVDLTDCDREPIHIPGSIQPHGVLLAVDPETLAVVQIAGDCRRFFHIDPKDLIGRSLRAWIGPAPIERLNLLLAGNLIVPKPFFAVEISVEEARFDLLAHVSDGLLILEAEPCAESSRNGVELVQGMLARLQTSSVKAMLDSLAAEVQAVTGFDRVMVYRFGDDDSGHVVAERLSSSDVVSFYDLHYPASDIPAQARELYRKNWIRFIPDATYSPWPLEPPLNPKTGKPLDLGFSTLRSVSPIHLEYLANMGVRSSMSLSIMIGDKLWGLVACHAAQPLRLSCCVRASLELFAQLVSLQLRTMLELEESTKRIVASHIQSALITAMSEQSLESGLIGRRPNLIDFIPAAGVTVRFEGANHSLGVTPGDAEIDGIATWLDAFVGDGVYATDRLAEVYPAAAGFLDKGAGILALSVSRDPRDYVIWFRPELVRTVTWAGNPEKPVEASPAGSRLSPRKSFEAWSETVRGRAEIWRPVEIEAARSLRVSILEIVLHRTDQIAKERAAAALKQDLLMAELDHRVKNTLATIQALVRFSSKSAEDLTSFTKAIELRLQSLSKAHSILTSEKWEGAPIRRLIEEEVSPYRLRGDAGITLSGPEYVINAKASLSLSLVLHELTTNAIKHGSLSVPDGRLSIVWKKVSRDGAEWLEIAWSESGGPAVRQPSRKGFGRTLLERVFAHDVHGAATLRFDPAGVICTLMIPFSSVLPPKHHQFGIPEIETAASPVSGKPLEGLRVFVMEDNALVAAEMVDALIEKGAVVLGPFHSLASGGVAATEQAFDVALLDVDIDGAAVWPVAKLIKNRGIPAVFATGFSNHSLRPTEFQNSQTIAKPYQADDITNVLLRACGRIAGEGKRR